MTEADALETDIVPRPHTEGPGREPYFVQSLDRGLRVISAFGHDSARLTLSEVAAATDLTRATARRFLLTLADLGYVRVEGRVFHLTPRVLQLGYAFLASSTLPSLAEPHLERLVAQVNESSSMSVLDAKDIVYIARVANSRIMKVTISVGTRFPAYATSMGRVLLAALGERELDAYLAEVKFHAFTSGTVRTANELRERLDDVRRDGYAVVGQELEDDLRSIAVPVRNRRGEVISAINVSAHVSHINEENARRLFLRPLTDAAEAIESELAML